MKLLGALVVRLFAHPDRRHREQRERERGASDRRPPRRDFAALNPRPVRRAHDRRRERDHWQPKIEHALELVKSGG